METLSKIVQDFGCDENLSTESCAKRDTCLEYLLMHMLDVNSYTRSKVLSEWQKLCCAGVIPLSHQPTLLENAALRLEDKSANVRKQALQLVRALLQGNPYAAKVISTKDI